MTIYFVAEFWGNKSEIKLDVQYMCHVRETAENWIREQKKPANRFVILTGDVIDGTVSTSSSG